jgi:predicted small secreted protein
MAKGSIFMMKQIFAVIGSVALLGTGLTSCDTPTGTGAAAGAGAGAIIGNIAGHGGPRSTLLGAAAGAAAGALIGHAIQEDQADRYGPRPEGGYPVAEWSGQRGLVVSPYPPHRLVDVRGIPHGALVRDPSSGGIFRRP